MSDDSFFREVEEELRTERLQNFWNRYGKLVIAGAVAIVVAVGSYRVYQNWQAQQAAEAGDAFMSAVRLAQQNKTDEAIAELQKIAEEGSPAYRALAQLRLGAELAKQKKWQEAVAAYDKAAQMKGVDENLKSIARLRAAALLVDHGSVTEVQTRTAPLLAPGSPYRASAREYLALAYYNAGDLEQSAKLFAEIRDDQATPPTLGQRARLMLDLIASQGGPAISSQTDGANTGQ